MYSFLQFNAFDRFDLVALNSINLAHVVQEADRKDRALLHQVRHVADSLAPRVRTETGDADEVAQLLRDLSCHWYLESVRPPSAPGGRPWKAWASEAWGGLFYESRVTGGWRKPRLADRLLWASRGRSEPEAALRERIFHRPPGREESETLDGRSHEEVLVLRVAQAILDDLASTPRSTVPVVALPHLNDLAGAVNLREVNSALQSLFHSFDEASFLFLDPNRNPEVGLCTLHWPSERRGTPGALYQLVQQADSSAAALPACPARTDTPRGDPAPDVSAWFAIARSRAEWIDLLTQLDGQGARLPPPPPTTCRQSGGYTSLRDALLQGPPINVLFAKVQWKGRPT
ncbi:MAG: hypothetical protein L3K08_06625, partial [Thermoplasmata archaeon]|nr:hypothetical protein [Thermoplasmata archaeon]